MYHLRYDSHLYLETISGMNAPVFFQFELGRAKAQLAEFFSEIPPKRFRDEVQSFCSPGIGCIRIKTGKDLRLPDNAERSRAPVCRRAFARLSKEGESPYPQIGYRLHLFEEVGGSLSVS